MLSSRCKFLWQCRPVLLCLLSLQWEGRNCQQQTEILPGFTIEAPAEVTVQRGLCVLIPCKFMVGPDFTITRDAIGIWYKGYIRYKKYKSVPVAASTNASQFPDTTNGRFIFTGNVSAGDCSFSISDAQPGDATHYLFRLEDKYPLIFSYMGVQPTISVSDLKEPDISPIKKMIAGKKVTLTCTAPTDCPGVSPNFRWEGGVNKQKTQMYTLQQQYGKVSYWSTITFTPSPRHHHTSLTCTVTFKEESTKTSITLNVEYLNKPNIFPKKKLIAGEQVTLTCSTFGNCMETSPTITWDGIKNIIKVGNYHLLKPRDNITYLSHITFTPLQTDHNTLLTCTVTCKGISTNHSIILDVEYLNKPDIFPKKKLIAGKQVTLTCTTFGNCMENSSTITWDGNINTTKARNNYFLPSSNNITYLSHITFTPSQTDHNTLLTCRVTCKGITTNQSIILDVEYLNKPDIFPKKKLIAGKQVTLTCSTFGNCMETSSTITWDGKINITSVGNDQLLHSIDNVTYLSHITFTPSQTDHNTLLTCTVTCKGISTNHGIILDVECPNEPWLDSKVIPIIVAIKIGILALMSLGHNLYLKTIRNIQEKGETREGNKLKAEESVYEALDLPTQDIYSTMN